MKSKFLVLFVLIFCNTLSSQSFKASQIKNTRVKTAYAEKWESLKNEISMQKINSENFDIYIRVFKKEKTLEVWMKSKSEKKFQLFKTFVICSSSGELGPKRKQGDGQVPEGFYEVQVFNPFSNYYLSLGINYPNKSDKIIGTGNLGGDIMIHGNCVTIGCLPLTDDKIKEVYVLAIEARNNGQQTIPVQIFPTKLNEEGMKLLKNNYSTNKSLIDFWKNLKTGFDYFELHKQLPKVSVDKAGKYLFD